MSVRLAFFHVKGWQEVGFERLLEKICADRFTGSNASGFLIDRRSAKHLSARFIEKVVIVDSLTDPLGNAFKQERIHFDELKFEFRTTPPELIVFDTNSAFKPFTGRLLEFSDFRLSITPVSWKPVQVLQRFEKEFESTSVYAATPHPVNLSAAVVVHLSFEGSEDVRKHVREFTKLKSVRYSSIRFRFVAQDVPLKCEIKENGMLTFFGSCDPLLIEHAIAMVNELCAEAGT